MQTKSIQRLNWDSDFFGFEVGKIDLRDISIYRPRINDAMDFDLIYAVSHSTIETDFGSLISSHFISYSDTKVDFCNDLNIGKTERPNINISLYQNELVESDLRSLSLQSSMFSRFRKDQKMPIGKCDEMYIIWISKECSQDGDKKVFVARENNKIIGFVSVDVSNEEYDRIGLIAVDKQLRGQKVGNRLVQHVMRNSFNTNKRRLKVATQGINHGAKKFYKSLGFYKINEIKICHLWRKK